MLRIKLAAVLAAAALSAGCAKETTAAPAAPTAPAAQAPAATATPSSANLVKVASSEVCMMNNQHMAKPQIPVVVEGRTYFGCCEMCKAKLANDPATRTGLDPVSQKPVDKSVAVIAKTASGAVLYFESEANLNAYAQRM